MLRTNPEAQCLGVCYEMRKTGIASCECRSSCGPCVWMDGDLVVAAGEHGGGRDRVVIDRRADARGHDEVLLHLTASADPEAHSHSSARLGSGGV